MRTTTMRLPIGRALVLCAGTATLLSVTIACNREQRRFRESPPSASPSAVRVSALQPGTLQDTTHVPGPYDNVAYHVTEGQRLFGWYNCAGCHANGGGGMGPPLMDDKWIYGSAPEQIYNTIVQGRPNGMPSFAGKIPTPQVWELVAYVRSLSSLNSTGARSSRTDHMMMYPGSQSLSDPAKPVKSFRPPAGEMP
jgi:cytochrome c oxidase cbb3-type subunit III